MSSNERYEILFSVLACRPLSSKCKASSKQVFHSEQHVHVGSQRQWTSVADGRELHAAFNNEARTCRILKSGSKIVFSGFASGHWRTAQATCSAVNESRFENQKQFTARLLILAGKKHVLEIRVQSLLVTHSKPIAFGAENCFRVSAKNKTTTRLGEREIEMRRQSSADRREL